MDAQSKAELIQNRLFPGMQRTKQCAEVPRFSGVENHSLCPFFHTGFLAPAVCGKLPGARFQIGEKQTRKPE